MLRKVLVTSVVAGLAASTWAPPARAMNMHVNGHQIILSGDVNQFDQYRLFEILNNLATRGVSIDTIVLRNSRGGDLRSGLDINSFARANGIKTVVSGYCISACSTMFVGGTQRAFANDQPLFRQYIGIHGASIPDGKGGETVAPPSINQPLYQMFVNDLGGTASTDTTFLEKSFLEMKDGQALGYIWDPNAGQNPSVYWCDSGSTPYSACEKFPNDNAYNLGFITQQNYAQTTDTLVIDHDVSGNINPNYYDPHDPASQPFLTLKPVPNQPGYVYLVFNDSAMSYQDSYGVLRVENGATWNLGTRSAADALWVHNGSVNLDGGHLDIDNTYVDPGSQFGGHGYVGGPDQFAYVFARGGTVQASGGTLNMTGEMVLYPQSALALQVHPGQGAPLRMGTFVDPIFGNTPGLVLSYNAALAVDVQPGFYKPGDNVQLIDGTVLGAFSTLSNASGTTSIDLTNTSEGFHPQPGSLISFNLVQNNVGLALVANDPFHNAVFCSELSGCGLGHTLNAIASLDDGHFDSVLGAIEFSSADKLHPLLGSLRGDGYAVQRNVALSLVQSIGGAIDQHIDAIHRGGQDNLALGGTLWNPRMTGSPDQFNLAWRYLVNDSKVATSEAPDGNHAWGRVFGSKGHIAGELDVTGANYRTRGVVLGLDHRFDKDTVAGASVSYGKATSSVEVGSFDGNLRSLGVAAYLNRNYGGGEFDARLQYDRIRDNTHRVLPFLPVATARGRSRGNSLTLHLENRLIIRGPGKVMWQPVLPSLDVTRLSPQSISEQGAGSADLTGRYKRFESVRAGVGIGAWRAFKTASGTRIAPHARVLWQHELRDAAGRLQAAFTPYADLPFAVRGPSTGPNLLNVNVGVDVHAVGRWSLSADYIGQFASRLRQNGAMLGLHYHF
jgi:hypothetical protein